MSYATSDDMIARFGEQEMILLSAKKGEALDVVNLYRVDQALTDASDTIDSYLRRRYTVPLPAPVPAAINRAAQMLARYDLALGPDTSPSEQMRLARKEALAWLDGLADGRLTMDGVEVGEDTSGAMVQDRAPMLGRFGCDGRYRGGGW